MVCLLFTVLITWSVWGCSMDSNGDLVWKAIWSLNTPPVVKMFLWRACSNILPTRENLLRLGISLDVHCPICGQANETIRYILWDCPSTQDVWGCGSCKIQKGVGGGSTFFHVVEEMLV